MNFEILAFLSDLNQNGIVYDCILYILNRCVVGSSFVYNQIGASIVMI